MAEEKKTTSNTAKGCGCGCLTVIVIAIFIVFIAYGCSGGSSKLSEEEYFKLDPSEITVDNIQLEYEASRGLNLNQQMYYKLDSQNMTPDQKMAEANEMIDRITPLFNAALELSHDDSVSSIATHVYGGYLALTQECRELINYIQTGSEESRNEFFRLNDVASDNFHDAQDLLNQ